MRWLTCMLGTALLVTMTGGAQAANSIVVESKSVPRGKSGVTVGVFFTNDVLLQAIVVPLEIRSIDTGAFMAHSLVATGQGRFAVFAGSAGWTIQRFLGNKSIYPDEFACATDSTGLVWGGADARSGSDSILAFVSPDALLYVVVGMTDSSMLAPGSDGAPGSGTPSVVLTFDVTTTAGRFEIDTTCVAQDNHVVFVREPLPNVWVVPSFTKGVVTIGCACACHGDPICDGAHNIQDVSKTIAVAFRGAPPVIDPNPLCPYTDTDVNCDGVTTIIDVTKMSNVVFRGANPNTEFCHPCP